MVVGFWDPSWLWITVPRVGVMVQLCLRLPYLLCLMCSYHSARLEVFLKEEMVPYEAEDSVLYEGRWVQHLLTLTSSEEFEQRIDTTWPRFWKDLSEHSVEERLVRDDDGRRRLGLRTLCRGGDKGSYSESVSKGESSTHWWIFGSWI